LKCEPFGIVYKYRTLNAVVAKSKIARLDLMLRLS